MHKKPELPFPRDCVPTVLPQGQPSQGFTQDGLGLCLRGLPNYPTAPDPGLLGASAPAGNGSELGVDPWG